MRPKTNRDDGDRVFRNAVAGAIAVTVVFTAWLHFHFVSDWATVAVDDIGEALAALIGGAACIRAARRAQPGGRIGWWLLGVSALAWGAGELWWTRLEVLGGTEVPFPSIADAGFLAAVPLAALALLLWPGVLSKTSDRLRALLDGGVIASALLFISWALVIGPMWRAPADRTLATVISLAYPVGDVVILTIVLVVLASADRRMWAPLVLVALGLAAIAVSDSAFAYLTDKGAYDDAGLTGAGWFAGWLLVGLAALHPAATATCAAQPEDEDTESLRVVLLPYIPLLLAVALLLARTAAGEPIGSFLAWNLGVAAALVLLRQLVVVIDNRNLATRLRAVLSDLRHREDQLEFQAFHDGLTGLANRGLFWDRLEHALVGRQNHPIAVLYLDLDEFKTINDRHGHLIGDMALAAVAERLRGCLRPADTLARLGGDEFGLLVEALEGDGRQPRAIAERLLESLDAPFVLGGVPITIGASVGMAVGRWETPDQAVATADAAMYRAKAAGRGCIEVEVTATGVPA